MEAVVPAYNEIDDFLKIVIEKIKVFGVVFRPRDKNTQALADLGITAKERENRWIVCRFTLPNIK